MTTTNRRVRRAPARRPTSRTLSEWLPYWENELGARDVSPRTVANQRDAVKQLIRGVGDVAPEALTPEVLIEWRDEMRRRMKDSSVNGYILTVGTFLNWLAAEGVLSESPMLQVPYLKIRGEDHPPVLQAEALRRIAEQAAKHGKGKSKGEALRDETILSLLQDTGLRASECAGLLLEHLNLPARQWYVHGDVAKGRKPRMVTFGFQTARLLNRYLREREGHPFAFHAQAFLGRRGPATYGMVYQMVKANARKGGVIGARPHLYRHTWAHDLKTQGVDIEVLMSLGGWSSTEMPMRYGRAARDARALETYQKMGSPVDRAKTRRAS